MRRGSSGVAERSELTGSVPTPPCFGSASSFFSFLSAIHSRKTRRQSGGSVAHRNPDTAGKCTASRPPLTISESPILHSVRAAEAIHGRKRLRCSLPFFCHKIFLPSQWMVRRKGRQKDGGRKIGGSRPLHRVIQQQSFQAERHSVLRSLPASVPDLCWGEFNSSQAWSFE